MRGEAKKKSNVRNSNIGELSYIIENPLIKRRISTIHMHYFMTGLLLATPLVWVLAQKQTLIDVILISCICFFFGRSLVSNRLEGFIPKNMIGKARMVLREKVGDRQLYEITKRIIQFDDIEDLAKHAMNLYLRTTESDRGVLYVKENGTYKSFSAHGEVEAREIQGDAPLIDLLHKKSEYIKTTDLVEWANTIKLDSLKKAKEMALNLKADIIMPISMDRLLGFLCLGRSKNFKRRDLENISTISFSLAMAIEKIFLTQIAIRDHLTSLYTRRHFDNVMTHIVSQALQNGYPLSFLMIDIDDFKQINDKYGHWHGDEVLRDVSKLILDNLRAGCLSFRYGGEELCVVLPRYNLNGAIKVSERILESCRSYAWEKRKVTASIGVSSLQKMRGKTIIIKYDCENITRSIITSADTALYKAKKRGKNRMESVGIINPSIYETPF